MDFYVIQTERLHWAIACSYKIADPAIVTFPRVVRLLRSYVPFSVKVGQLLTQLSQFLRIVCPPMT